MKEDKKIITWDFSRKTLMLVIWAVIITVVFLKRDSITLDAIIDYSPKNIFAAILIMLGLFLLKSVSFFIYGGLLYTASGVIFPLPLAIAVNFLGTFVMCSVPFFIGKKAGKGILQKLFKKYPKLCILKEFQERNEFLVSFFTRIVGILPADIVSMYMGASLTQYKKYILGTLLGLFPSMVSFSVMGMNANDVTSPAFIVSALFETLLMLLSIIYVFSWRIKQKKNKEKK